MITAAEALRLPSAKLTPEEARAADALEKAIDLHIRQHMSRGGTAYDAPEIRGPVIAEVQWRLRKAGWQMQTFALQEQSPLGVGIAREPRLVGYKLVLVPTDEAYRAADARAEA